MIRFDSYNGHFNLILTKMQQSNLFEFSTKIYPNLSASCKIEVMCINSVNLLNLVNSSKINSNNETICNTLLDNIEELKQLVINIRNEI
jgi:hypothetical protein